MKAEDIETLEDFLSHAVALEWESVDRYTELADVMEVHNNLAIAQLFRQFAEFGRKHANEVEQHAAGLELRAVPAWEFGWEGADAPESGDYGEVHYLMRPVHVLKFALHNERGGRDFYQAVADGSPGAEVRSLAAQFADEESRHVAILERWIAEAPDAPDDWDEDPDPVNVPD